jgi:hypothetical protein
MNTQDLLQHHNTLCEELYALTVEENRLLRATNRPPDAAWRTKKQALSDRWSESMAQLKAHPPRAGEGGGPLLEQARQRCLQIMHLDRENEKLLLRCSLSAAKPPAAPISRSAAAHAYAPSKS